MGSWWWPSSTVVLSNSTISIEDRLRRVTARDIACVTPEDIERVKKEINLDDLKRVMRVMLEDNRYGEVIAVASHSSLNTAAQGLTGEQLGGFSAIIKSNILALYNVLTYVSIEHLMEMKSIFNGDQKNI